VQGFCRSRRKAWSAPASFRKVFPSSSMEVLSALEASTDAHLKSKIEKSMHTINQAVGLYGCVFVFVRPCLFFLHNDSTRSWWDACCRHSGLALSFNGGKDSTVLLHLLRAVVVQRKDALGTGGLGGIATFFFHHDNDFEEVTSFTYECNKRYNLDMHVLTGDFKTGLVQFLQATHVNAIFLGTRHGDPNAKDQETFSPSSPGWPPFMRINPVLDWTYHDVWSFLCMAHLPYCCLYDKGYTSLGSVETTHPNEALALEDGRYAPAHSLNDARLERAGRNVANGNWSDSNLVRRTHSSLSGTFGKDQIRTVGLLLIGDEILSAKVEDVNMRFLCSELRAIGWRVDRAVFVRDSIDLVSKALRDLSEANDAVITAGGLGPTLDDVTMAAVAEAFERKLQRHPELERRIMDFMGDKCTDAHLKMAETPEGPEVVLLDYEDEAGNLSPFPLLRVRNVYVLPGIPSLVQAKWPAVRQDLSSRVDEASSLSPFHSIVMRLRLSDESEIADALKQAASAAGPAVSLGSYPVSNQSDGCEVVLSLESKDTYSLDLAHKHLLGLLPPQIVASEHYDEDDKLNSPAEAGCR
jgi:FAD synthetase